MHNKNIGWNVAPSLHVRDISTPKIKEWFILNSPNQRYVQNIARVESLRVLLTLHRTTAFKAIGVGFQGQILDFLGSNISVKVLLT